MKNFQNKMPTAPDVKTGITQQGITRYMARNLVTFTPDTEIMKAIQLLVEKKISGAPVLNENREIIGMIDDKDCLRVLIDTGYQKLPIRGNVVSKYMDAVFRTVRDDMRLIEAADIFLNSNLKRLLVIDEDNRLVGQLSRSDVLRAISQMDLY